MHENHIVTEGKRTKWFDKTSYWILLAITFLTPIFFVPASFISTQFGTSLLFSLGTIAVILLYIISTLVSGSIELPKPAKYTLGFLALVPVVYTLAGIANGFSRLSFFGYTFDISTVGFMLLGFAYAFLISMLFNNKVRIFHAYFAFFVSLLILALFLLIRIVFGAEALSFGIFQSLVNTPVGSWNNVGILFGAGAILSLLTYEMAGVSKLMKIILTLAIVLSLFFLALVNFNFIWIIVAICSFLFILYNLFSQGRGTPWNLKEKVTHIPLYSSIVFIVSLVFIIWGSSIGGSLANKLEVTNIEVRPTLAVTMEIAKNTIKDRPLFGSGPNTFTTQWLTWKPNDIVSTIFWNTDFTNGIGLIPTFAVTTGLIGILSWLLFLGYYVYLGIKSIFTKVEDRFVKYLLTSSFFVSLYFWIMTFVYVPSTVVFILTLLFTGLFFASVYLERIIPTERRMLSANPKTGFLSSLLLVTLIIGSVALGYGLIKSSVSLWHFQKSAYALNTMADLSLSESHMKKAIAAVPHDVYYRALSEIYVIRLSQILSQDPTKVDEEAAQKDFSDTLTKAITAGLKAKDADPSNYINWIALGRVYEAVSIPALKIEGAYESAQLAYSEALRRNPKNPGILILFSRLAIVNENLDQARSYAQQAIQLKNNYIDAYFLLSQIEAEEDNLEAAIESVTAASVIDPTNPGIFFQLGLLEYNNENYPAAILALEKATSLTPDYANAKYFLGLSYAATGNTPKAIAEFERLRITNPESQEVITILENLRAGRPALTGLEDESPEASPELPVEENQ